jgi:hypothetical protein
MSDSAQESQKRHFSKIRPHVLAKLFARAFTLRSSERVAIGGWSFAQFRSSYFPSLWPAQNRPVPQDHPRMWTQTGLSRPTRIPPTG